MKYIKTLLITTALAMSLTGSPVHAQGGNLGLDDAARSAGFATSAVQDPEIVIGRVVKGVLSFLGLIGFSLVIYSGFILMTSRGEKDKVSNAKDIMEASVIGILIIVLAYAVTDFVISAVSSQTLN